MPALETDTTVVARDDHVATTLDGETVLLNNETGTYQGLRGVGPEVWAAIQEPTTVEAVVETIATNYDVDASRCERDVRDFLQELADHQLVEIDAETTP